MDKIDPRYVIELIEALTIEGARVSEFEYEYKDGARIRLKFKDDPPPPPVVEQIATPVVGFEAAGSDDKENDDPGSMHARLMRPGSKLPSLE